MEEKPQAPGGPEEPDQPTRADDRGSEPSPAAEVTEPVGPSGFTGPVHTPHTAEAGSKVDAMGLDKYRQVVGKSYSPTKAQQAKVFGIFFACVALLFIGGKLLTDQLDKPPESNPAKAPWATQDAPEGGAVTIPTEAIEPTPQTIKKR